VRDYLRLQLIGFSTRARIRHADQSRTSKAFPHASVQAHANRGLRAHSNSRLCVRIEAMGAADCESKADKLCAWLRTSVGSSRYARQKLGLVDDFIQRLGAAGLNIFQCRIPKFVQPPGFRISFNLPIPSIFKIHLGEAREKLALFRVGKLLHRVNDFCDRAHELDYIARIAPVNLPRR
jgi:hypothetical protein